MDASQKSGARLDLSTAPEGEIEDALVRWDELEPAAFEDLARDAVHGPRLRRLQLAEAWLREPRTGGAPRAVRDCPGAEELYDYGRGPGSAPLAPARRAQIDRHILRCAPCRAFLCTLERRPPVPLDLLPLAADAVPVDAGPAAQPAAPARLRLLRGWLPLTAAAAALLLALPLLQRAATTPALPTRPFLRDGAGADALLLPRGPVLWLAELAPERRPARWIELAPVPGADHYRVQLSRHGGGAFELGEPAGELRSGTALLPLPTLPPGHYTYAAWARVGGLERPLGRRDFQVIEDADLTRSLARATSEADLRRLIVALDARGLLSDARALARLLSASPEREAYLAAPGR